MAVAAAMALAGCAGSTPAAGGSEAPAATASRSAATTSSATGPARDPGSASGVPAASNPTGSPSPAGSTATAPTTGTAPTATAPTGTAPTGSAPTGTAPTPTAPTATAPPRTSPTGGGCRPGGGGIPAGATKESTVDVDGDGRRDTLWLTAAGGSVRLGITTASGRTFATGWDSASPVERRALVARPAPGAQVVVLADDGRAVQLFTVLGCAIEVVRNVQDQPYRFDLGFTGYGSGVGCEGPGDGLGLAGLNAVSTGGRRYAVTRTFVEVSGTRATNGRSDTLHATLPADGRLVQSAQEVTCGELTMDRDGLAARAEPAPPGGRDRLREVRRASGRILSTRRLRCPGQPAEEQR